ncbi:MAG: type IV toxin-antitoxin system AbiEi family antitoxin domain-containing protein [Fimbriimonadaceae bacterium]
MLERKPIPERELILEYVQKHGVARANELAAEGFHSQEVTRLVAAGQLERLARGLYSVSNHELTAWHDLAEVAKAVPDAVIALISALAYHEIGTQLPYQTWIALPAKTWKPQMGRSLRIVKLTEPYYSAGIEQHEIEGVRVKIYSAAKTVADCFRMRSKVGYDTAVEALRDGWRERKFTLDELMHFAKLNRVERVMRPYIEAITQ